MKKFVIISIVSTSILSLSALVFFVYRLGYCNGCDKYIGASECKPKRKLNFFGN